MRFAKIGLRFFKEAGLQNDRAFPLTTLHFFFTISKADIFKYFSSFESKRGSLHFEVFNYLYGVPVT